MKIKLLDWTLRPAARASLFPGTARKGTVGKYSLLLLAGLAALTLTGCGPRRLRVDFTGYEKVYAETSNRELLLNLARLENREPTYFFKIGSIQSLYKIQANLASNASYAIQGMLAGGSNETGGGNPGFSYENDPSFTFIPVNDQTNAQLLLQQIPGETFYLLYQQGWRVDQLFRLMVDRVELTTKTPTGCDVETIRNIPPPAYGNSTGNAYSRDQDILSQYTTFLRISAVLYWLQKHGNLLLRVTYTFVPYDTNSALSDPAAGGGAVDTNGRTVSKTPSASDVIAASNKNAVWEKDKDGNWLLGEKVANPVFYLAPLTSTGASGDAGLTADIEQIRRDIEADPEMAGVTTGPALRQVLMDLSNGFSIAGTSTPQNGGGGLCPTTPGTSQVSSHLLMRSLIGLMAAAAQEQEPFDALVHNDPKVPMSVHLAKRLPLLPKNEQEMLANMPAPSFLSAVPAIEQLPLLRLTGAPHGEEMQPIIQMAYRGKEYRIADLKTENDTENQYWNRDVFRLINELTSQVTVDISKFPLTTFLQ